MYYYITNVIQTWLQFISIQLWWVFSHWFGMDIVFPVYLNDVMTIYIFIVGMINWLSPIISTNVLKKEEWEEDGECKLFNERVYVSCWSVIYGLRCTPVNSSRARRRSFHNKEGRSLQIVQAVVIVRDVYHGNTFTNKKTPHGCCVLFNIADLWFLLLPSRWRWTLHKLLFPTA